ncbi:MAG TPA: class I SAM-dependent methyltransferase [Sedimentisphaerales bacterium]|nr:class I SAM-dependent methyltransferase [Sedimentisphaerales bacterium]
MDRVLEPEVMEDEQQAIAYARADFSSSNQMFVDGLIETFESRLGTVLDLGCGPGDIPIRLARAMPSAYVVAVDASEAMVCLAHEAVETADLLRRVRIVRGRIPGLRLRAGGFDAIISKDLLHHLPDPVVFWDEVKRLGRPGAAVYVMDLFRPQSEDAAARIVETVSADEHEILKTDFYNSLLAAFTPDEVRDQLSQGGLEFAVEAVSERHMRIRGVL